MDWNDGFRSAMTDIADQQGRTYEQVVTTTTGGSATLFMVDTRLWWAQVKRRWRR